MTIRKYKESDRGGLIELWEKVFTDPSPHNMPASKLNSKLLVDDLVFVAQSDNDEKIIGACMAGYDGHRGWLYAVAVDPDYRRKGVGAALVQKAMLSLKKLGCAKLNLQIRASNTEVAKFYQSLGFTVEDRLSMGMFLE